MLIGHTGDDVKLHYFENGNCVGNFPLATNESYINKGTGEQVVNTEWHNIVVRNKAAEICEKYLKKGDKVYIEGRIRTRKYQDNTGQDRYITEIIALDFTFLTPKGQNGPKDENDASRPQQGTNPTAGNSNRGSSDSTDYGAVDEEDDLPF